jgi:hypothetical protein
MQCIDRFIQANQSGGGTVVIITGDADFFRVAERVKGFGFNLELLYYTPSASSALRTVKCGWHCDWQQFLQSWAGTVLHFPYATGAHARTGHPSHQRGGDIACKLTITVCAAEINHPLIDALLWFQLTHHRSSSLAYTTT